MEISADPVLMEAEGMQVEAIPGGNFIIGFYKVVGF